MSFLFFRSLAGEGRSGFFKETRSLFFTSIILFSFLFERKMGILLVETDGGNPSRYDTGNATQEARVENRGNPNFNSLSFSF